MKKTIILKTNRSCYATNQLYATMTVGQLINKLQYIAEQEGEDCMVAFGNDLMNYGFYTYGEITNNNFYIETTKGDDTELERIDY